MTKITDRIQKRENLKWIMYDSIMFILLVIIDDRNLMSWIYQYILANGGILLGFAISIFIIIALMLMNFIDLIKYREKNSLDKVVINTFITGWLYFFIVCSKYEMTNFKYVIFMALFWTDMILFILREETLIETIPTVNKNIYDLKEIYDNKINKISNEPILVEEREVDYDIFGREIIINNIISSIKMSSNKGAYTIGISGEWGSGKTSIIKNVKNILDKNEYLFIDDFELWIFGTQEELVLSMYDKIIKKAGIRYSLFQDISIRNNIKLILSDVNKFGKTISNMFILDEDKYERLNSIKEKMSKYLLKTDKKIIFVIDNIERADSKNIILLFKLIGSFLDLPNVTYILVYDKERMMPVISDTEKIDPRYIEKIVNQEINIPEIGEHDRENAYKKIIENIMRLYGVEYTNEYDKIIEFIIDEIKDIRTFKRMINTVFSIVFYTDTMLDKRDLLGIELIRFLEPSLYEKIKEDRDYFISIYPNYNRDTIEMVFEYSAEGKSNEDFKKYFNQLLSDYPKWRYILSDMFENVDEYTVKYPKYNDNEESREMRICSGKAFDLYFVYSSNNYYKINKDVNTFVDNIINIDKEKVYEYIDNNIDLIKRYDSKEFLVQLENTLNRLSDDKKEVIMVYLFNTMFSYYSKESFNESNVSFFIEILIGKYISKTSIESIQYLLKNMRKQYGKLNNICRIKDNVYKLDVNMGKIGQLENLIINMSEEIISNNIDIYSDKYYIWKNIYALKKYKKDKLEKYIQTAIENGHIYKILGDIIQRSIVRTDKGNKYRYIILIRDIKDLYLTEEVIDRAIDNLKEQNEKEKFILSVYKKYKEEKNEIDADGIISNKYIEL